MSLDLFSSMDFFFCKFKSLSMFSFVFSFCLVYFLFFWKKNYKRNYSFLLSLKTLILQKFSSKLKSKMGSILSLLTMFYFILGSKLLGLFPFDFGWTSHMLLILQISLFFWFMINVSNLLYKTMAFFSHYTPQGVPLLLGLFLAKIELMSNLIRPLTLSLRLGINITTGHILLALISVMGVNSKVFFLIMILGIFYFFFELFVMLMQAMVYSLLLSQYFEE